LNQSEKEQLGQDIDDSEEELDEVNDDPELVAFASLLAETAPPSGIDLAFQESLHDSLLKLFTE